MWLMYRETALGVPLILRWVCPSYWAGCAPHTGLGVPLILSWVCREIALGVQRFTSVPPEPYDITVVTLYIPLGKFQKDEDGKYLNDDTYKGWMETFGWLTNRLVVFVEGEDNYDIFKDCPLFMPKFMVRDFLSNNNLFLTVVDAGKGVLSAHVWDLHSLCNYTIYNCDSGFFFKSGDFNIRIFTCLVNFVLIFLWIAFFLESRQNVPEANKKLIFLNFW
ncbi:hypothetical protein Btru_050635 [Bulinus truncatus]|nr:hypothetical protein Btru_050635 [Bulinus truncatus]